MLSALGAEFNHDPYFRLYDLFLRFNRRLLFILTRLKPPLSTNESHILTEVVQGDAVVARDLSELLSIEKSTLSRALASLRERGVVEVQDGQKDRRFKTLALTPSGREILDAYMDIVNLEVDECFAPLTRIERLEFLHLFKTLNDGLGGPSFHARPVDDPLVIEVRRGTRCYGFIGDNCMGTGMPSDGCQVLHNILVEGGEMQLQELGRRLPFEITDFSRLVSDLAARDLLAKRQLKSDRRRYSVSLTRAGDAVARRNLEKGREFFIHGARMLDAAAVSRLVSLIEKFVLAPLVEDFSPPALGWDLREILDEGELTEAREFLLEGLVKNDLHKQASWMMLSPDNRVFALRQKGTIKGVLEVVIKKPGVYYSVINLFVASELSSGRAGLRLLAYTLSELMTRGLLEGVEIPEKLLRDWVGAEFAEGLKGPMMTLGPAEIERIIMAV